MLYHCDKTKQKKEGITADMSKFGQAHPKLRRQGYIDSPCRERQEIGANI